MRYVVLLLVIYSLVQLPAAIVSIADLATHGSEHDEHEECAGQMDQDADLPSEDVTSISFLRCMEMFAKEVGDVCEVVAHTSEMPLPWCAMASETSHALRLSAIFELSLLGWVANVLANPIIYAFW